MIETTSTHSSESPSQSPAHSELDADVHPGFISRTSNPRPNVFKDHPRKMIALACCLLLTLAVFLVLPQLVNQNHQTVTTRPTTPPTQNSTNTETASNDQQNLLARTQAQDALAEIKDAQQRLQNKNVSVWIENEYAAAISDIQQGDLHYRQQRYSDALTAYTRAGTALEKLEAQVEPRLAQALSAGITALEKGNQEAALELFQLALALEGNHPASPSAENPSPATLSPATLSPATTGIARAKVLPELMAHIAEGERLLSESPEAALLAFNRALALDNEHPLPRSGRERAQQTINNTRYQNVMSKGFQHLNAGQYQNAISAFKQAVAINPKANEARSALAQAQIRDTQTQIQQLLQQAQANETQENWQAAVKQYRKALEFDSTISESKVGEIRASTRAELDQKLNTLLADPLRLASNTSYREAEQLLKDAQNIPAPGSVLRRQIDTLQQALTAARIPVLLTLQSDNATRITLLKIGDLGMFQSKSVNLTPGRYVATGYRQGYRDVRVEFEVSATSTAPQIVQVQCDETI